MNNRDCGFLLAMAILANISLVSFTWSLINYRQAYEVNATQCQYVKHSSFTDHRGNLNGYVTICWQVPELEPDRVDGPVTWCRGEHVVTGISCDGVMAELKEKYPITHPPVLFPCYKAASDHRRMFLTKPDLNAWKDKFSVGIFFLLDFIIALLIWSTRDYQLKSKQD